MNKARRKALDAIQDRITLLGMGTVHAELQQCADEVEALRDEEQEAFDNLPEALQDSATGQDMTANIDWLTEAYDALNQYADIEEATGEAFARIEDAKGEA